MGISRQKALERLNTRSSNIVEHLEKIARNPNSQVVKHWKNEIRNWIREMEDALPHAGKRTAEGWEKLVDAYKRVLEDLP